MNMRLGAARTIGLWAGLILALIAIPTAADAQGIPNTGGRVFGLVGGSFGDGETAILTSGGAGLRLTRTLGIDFELLHVSDLELSDDRFFILARPTLGALLPPFDIDHEGSVTAFLTKFTVEFPVAGNRLIPFVSGGGGIGHLSEEIEFGFNDSDSRFAGRLGPVFDEPRPAIFPPPHIERSETGLALTVGGGLDVRLWRGLSVGADVRWLRLLAGQDKFDFAQIASRVSYRF